MVGSPLSKPKLAPSSIFCVVNSKQALILKKFINRLFILNYETAFQGDNNFTLRAGPKAPGSSRRHFRLRKD